MSLRQALGPVLHHLVHEADAERLVGCEEGAQLQRQLRLPLSYRVQHRVLDIRVLKLETQCHRNVFHNLRRKCLIKPSSNVVLRIISLTHSNLEPEWSHDAEQRLVEADGELGSLHDAVVAAEGQQTPARGAVARDGSRGRQLVAVQLDPHLKILPTIRKILTPRGLWTSCRLRQNCRSLSGSGSCISVISRPAQNTEFMEEVSTRPFAVLEVVSRASLNSWKL